MLTIHSALAASQSTALDKLINGNFKEAGDGKAVLEAVDEQKFVRFCEFAYTADYGEKHPPTEGMESLQKKPTEYLQPEENADPRPDQDHLEESFDDPWHSGLQTIKKKKEM